MICEAGNFFQNAVFSQHYTFDISPGISLNAPTDQYTLWLLDFDDFDDFGANDYRAGVNFTPYNGTNGFPTAINLDAGGEVTFTIHVSYTF